MVLSTYATENERNQNESANTSSVGSGSIDGDIQYLLSIVKLAKFKKPIFAKVNSFKTYFFTIGAKRAFIYVKKVFIKALILRNFNLEHHI